MTQILIEEPPAIEAPTQSTKAPTVDRVISLIRKHLALKEDEKVSPKDTLSNVLGIDSLDALELFLALEEELDRNLEKIQNRARKEWKTLTVQGLADLLT